MKKKILLVLFFTITVSMNAQSHLKSFFELSGPKRTWVIFHPFVAKKTLKISEFTRLETKNVIIQKFLKGNGNGGQVDAFRHAFWMASLTAEIGWRKARKLGVAHEKGNYKDYKKRRNEDGEIPDKVSSEMDLFNNDVGIKIGKNNSENLKNSVINAVLEGKCKIIRKDTRGNFLDNKGKIISKESLKGKWENQKCLVWSNN